MPARSYAPDKVERTRQIRELLIKEADKKTPRWSAVVTRITKQVEGATAEEVYLAWIALMLDHTEIEAPSFDPYEKFREERKALA